MIFIGAGGYNPIYKINFDFFKNKNRKYYYFLGLVASDGYVNDNRIEIALNEKDKSILDKLKNIIQPNKKLYYNKSTNSYKLTIHNMEISQKTKKILGMKSNKKHKEMTFPKVPKKYLKDFVRGYFDGDGSVGPTKGQRKIDGEIRYYHGIRVRILGNKMFLKELNEVFRDAYHHRTNAIRKKTGANVKVITYNFSTAEAFMDWIYKEETELKLERKFKKYYSLKEQN